MTLRGDSVEPRRSILEYVQALKPRYRKASKEEKGRMLDEFTNVTGLHRKSAIRLLNRVSRAKTGKRRGRRCGYGSDVVGMLKAVWEASDRLFQTSSAIPTRAGKGAPPTCRATDQCLYGRATPPNKPIHNRPIVTALASTGRSKRTYHYPAGESA